MHKRFGKFAASDEGIDIPRGFARFLKGGVEFRKGKILSSDDLQVIVLQLLSEAPRHGYEIIKAIEEHCSGVYAPSPGMVYPVLTYLEELSLATSETEGNKKSFKITAEGKKFLAKNHDRSIVLMEMLKRYGRKIAHFQNEAAQEDEENRCWGGDHQQTKEWHELRAAFHDIRLQIKTAVHEKLATSSFDERKRILKILRNAIQEIRSK